MARGQLDKHDLKWRDIEVYLIPLGYDMVWEHNINTDSRRYAIRKQPSVGVWYPMTTIGIYDDEDTAMAMAKLIISNGRG
jgi:hypothetical protein